MRIVEPVLPVGIGRGDLGLAEKGSVLPVLLIQGRAGYGGIEHELVKVGVVSRGVLDGGVDACSRKVAEEATEVLLAAKDHAAGSGARERVIEESADLVYHLLVLLAERGIDLGEVETELARRAG